MPFRVKDYYFKQAKKRGSLARSVFKLEEIDRRFALLKPGMRVVDLGYFPGSWSSHACRAVGQKGEVIGVDIKPEDGRLGHLVNFKPLQGDILESPPWMGNFDVILSDMAPNTTGIKSLDQDRSLNLVEKVFELLASSLRPGGNLLVKVFDSHKAGEFLREKKPLFRQFIHVRPKATRSASKEFFVVAKHYIPC